MAKYLCHGAIFTINGKSVGGLITITTPTRARAGSNGPRFDGAVHLAFRHDPADLGQLELERNFATDGRGARVPCTIVLPAPASRTYAFTGVCIRPPQGMLEIVDDNVASQEATVQVLGAVDIDGAARGPRRITKRKQTHQRKGASK